MSNTKKIGITCDDYKTKSFRKGLLKEGYKLEFDGPSGVNKVHLFRIEVPESEYDAMVNRVAKTVKKLDLEFKRSN